MKEKRESRHMLRRINPSPEKPDEANGTTSRQRARHWSNSFRLSPAVETVFIPVGVSSGNGEVEDENYADVGADTGGR